MKKQTAKRIKKTKVVTKTKHRQEEQLDFWINQ
jgi:hypothetical protein